MNIEDVKASPITEENLDNQWSIPRKLLYNDSYHVTSGIVEV